MASHTAPGTGTAGDPGTAGTGIAADEAARPPRLVALAQALEGDVRLDRAVDALRPLAAVLVSSPRRRGVLLGRPMGHAAHPLLTDAPLGAWMSALLLDVVGGPEARPAARTLVGVGVLAAAPTALTGLAEWAHTDARSARVGVVHAAGNTVALALFAASYLARRREHHGRGTTLGLAGGLVAGLGGFLGAHLAIARGTGSRDIAFADSLPADQVAPPEARDGTLT